MDGREGKGHTYAEGTWGGGGSPCARSGRGPGPAGPPGWCSALTGSGICVVAEAGDGAEAILLAARYRPDVGAGDPRTLYLPAFNGPITIRRIAGGPHWCGSSSSRRPRTPKRASRACRPAPRLRHQGRQPEHAAARHPRMARAARPPSAEASCPSSSTGCARRRRATSVCAQCGAR